MCHIVVGMEVGKGEGDILKKNRRKKRKRKRQKEGRGERLIH